ncbi:MAG: hypothetical protein IJJ33_04045, partial [Victivallales bacterium]|nr:hypothetical protein [Victivallales bacterium]
MSKRNWIYVVLIVALCVSLGLNAWQFWRDRAGVLDKQVGQNIPELPSVPVLGTKTEENMGEPAIEVIGSSLTGSFADDGRFCLGTMKVSFLHLSPDQKIALSDIKIQPAPKALGKLELKEYMSWRSEEPQAQLILHGGFDPDILYAIQLPSGLRTNSDDGNRQFTKTPFSVMVKGTLPSPFLRFTEAGPYYPLPKGGKILSWPMKVKVYNMKEVTVNLWRMDNQNLDIADHRRFRLSRLVASKTIKTNVPPNLCQEMSLELADLAVNLQPGLYVLLQGEEQYGDPYFDDWNWMSDDNYREVILTDLGVTATVDTQGRKAAVSIHSLTTGKPVANASFRLTSRKRQLVAQGQTDAAGVALVNFEENYNSAGDPPAILVAQCGDDVTRQEFSWKNELSKVAFNNSGRLFRDGPQAFVFPERGVYRPGETVQLTAFVRKPTEKGYRAVSTPFQLTVTDGEGHKLHKSTLTPDADGYAQAAVQLPISARSGVYQAVCAVGKDEWGYVFFQVGVFTPDRIKVTLRPQQEKVLSGEKLGFDLEARYYFGTLADNGTVSASLYATTAPFPPHWKEWKVGPLAREQSVLLGSVAKKKLPCEELVFALDANRLNSTLPSLLTAEATVQEPGARAVTGRASVHYDPRPAYLGLRKAGSQEQTVNFDWRCLTWENQEASFPKGTALVGKLARYKWVYCTSSRNGHANREWVQVCAEEQELPGVVIGEKTSGTFTVPVKECGSYQLTMTIQGQDKSVLGMTEVEFHHWWGDAGTVRSANPNLLTAKTDRPSYRPGDTAKVTFTANGAGFGFAAAGERQLNLAKALEVMPGENTFEIPIPASILTADHFVELTVVTKLDSGDWARAYALLRIPLDQASHRLDLALDAPEKAEPTRKIKVRLTAKSNGQPTSATVRLFAVDEGILALTDYSTPDIFAFFHGRHVCGFETYDIYSSIYPGLAIRRSNQTGGGASVGDRIAQIRQAENAVVVLPPIRVPASGETTVEMTLPNHTGALRLMAVAAGEMATGSSERPIILREQASVLASVPVAAADGDEFHALFRIFNHELDTTSASLDVALPAFLKANKLHYQINVPKGESRLVSVPVTVASPTPVSGEVFHTLRLGGRMISGKSPITIRSATSIQTGNRYLLVKPGETAKVFEATEWQDVRRVEVRANAPFIAPLKDSLDWLMKYPYGCLEQTVSTAFPFLEVTSLCAIGALPMTVEQGRLLAQSKLNQAIQRVLTMQRGTRFLSWPDSNFFWNEVTPYAIHFLLASKGVQEKESVRLLTKALFECMDRKSDDLKAYAYYVLSLAGQKDAVSLSRVVAGKESATAFARFFAGATMIQAGYAAEGTPILKQALAQKAWRVVPDMWFFDSTATRTGMMLHLLMGLLPDAPEALEMAADLQTILLDNGKNAWGSTRDNAWATMGLASFAARLYAGNGGDALKVAGTLTCAQDNGSEQFQKSLFKNYVSPKGSISLANTGDVPV